MANSIDSSSNGFATAHHARTTKIQEWRNRIPLRYNLDKFGGTSAKKQAFLRSVCTNFLQRHAAVQAVEQRANPTVEGCLRVRSKRYGSIL